MTSSLAYGMELLEDVVDYVYFIRIEINQETNVCALRP